MRLTLRTLLAYLDDLLDPADAAELGTKIQESDFASQLVHRIRSAMRRLRLAAPKLDGKGLGLDANSVAEYLDNTLPQDRIPDFERLCLESDIHLAEVAACHQILALVVVEPAPVEPTLRKRIASLVDEATAGGNGRRGTAAVQGRPVPQPPEFAPHTPRWPQEPAHEQPADAHDLPDYLRPTRRTRLLPLAITLIAAFALATVGILATGPLDARHPLIGGLFPNAPAPTPPPAGDNRVASRDRNDAPAAPPNAAVESPRSVEPSSPPETEPVTASEPPPAAPTPSDPFTRAPRFEGQTLPAGTTATSESEPAGSTPPDEQRGLPPPVEPGTNVPPGVSPAADDGQAPPTAAAEPPSRFLTVGEILLRWQDGPAGWTRAAPQDALATGDRLLALPAFRPQVELSPSATAVLVGPTDVTLVANPSTGAHELAMRYGRLLLKPSRPGPAQAQLRIRDQSIGVTLESADSWLAVEVDRFLPPGANPESDAAEWIVRVFAGAGSVQWQMPVTASAVTLEGGQRGLAVGSQPLRVTAGKAPAWVSESSISFLDRGALRQLEPLLATHQPALETLLAQVPHRRTEVRSLVARALTCLDQYDAWVDALNDKDLRSYWSDQFLAGRSALARDPASARSLRTTLERLRGEEGKTLHRLLRGYSPEQLLDNGAQELVGYLEHPAMDVRVLAYENLRRMTGRTLHYRPEREPRQQRPSLVDWQRALRDGTVAYRTLPQPGFEEPSEGEGEK